MGERTKIAWTQHTWNPWRGCHPVSTGCLNCYAAGDAKRYGLDFTTVTRCKTWWQPLKWNEEAAESGRKDLVFVCSWSDFWHKDADKWRSEAFNVMDQCPNLVFQIPTKRPQRIRDHWESPYWMMVDGMGRRRENVWLGASAACQRDLETVLPHLLACRDLSPVLWLSLEPLVGPVDLSNRLLCEHISSTGIDSSPISDPHKIYKCDECGIESVGDEMIARKALIDWVVCGGESGQKARPCETSWIASIVRQCERASVPCFVKQLGQNPWCGYYDDSWRDIAFDRPHTIWQPSSGGCVEWDHATFGQPAPGAMISWKPKDRAGADPSEWPEALRVRQFPK